MRAAGGEPAPVLAPYESNESKIFDVFLILSPIPCVCLIIELFYSLREYCALYICRKSKIDHCDRTLLVVVETG